MLKSLLNYNNKVIFSCIIGAIWIYNRKLQHYNLLPRRSLLGTLLVIIWIYINYYEPFALPIGLLILYLYGQYIDKYDNPLI